MPAGHAAGFRHEALLYSGPTDFVDRVGAFIRDSIDGGERVMVIVHAGKIALLRSALGDIDGVTFADMADIGRNPARIIPAWRDFAREAGAGRLTLRGVGEPVWPGRRSEELVECHRHEALVNLAFADTPGLWLVCPYDVEALDHAVIDETLRNHPLVSRRGLHFQSGAFREDVAAPFDVPLPEPDEPPHEIAFERGGLDAVRAFVSRHAAAAGLERSRTEDLVMAVNEVATNTLRHAGGRGLLRVWRDEAIVCEVRDDGRIVEPLVGRVRPRAEREDGFGLWLVNQTCDLVQIRTLASGSVVRIHMSPR